MRSFSSKLLSHSSIYIHSCMRFSCEPLPTGTKQSKINTACWHGNCDMSWPFYTLCSTLPTVKMPFCAARVNTQCSAPVISRQVPHQVCMRDVNPCACWQQPLSVPLEDRQPVLSRALLLSNTKTLLSCSHNFSHSTPGLPES